MYNCVEIIFVVKCSIYWATCATLSDVIKRTCFVFIYISFTFLGIAKRDYDWNSFVENVDFNAAVLKRCIVYISVAYSLI